MRFARRLALVLLTVLGGCVEGPPAAPPNPDSCPGAETRRFSLARRDPGITHTVDRSDPARVLLDVARPGAPRVVQVLAQGIVAVERQTALERVQMRLEQDLATALPLRPGTQFETALTVVPPNGEPLPGSLTLTVGAPGRVQIGDCGYDTLSVETVTSVGPYVTRLVQDYAPVLGTVIASENPASATQGGERLSFDTITVAPPPQGTGLLQ